MPKYEALKFMLRGKSAFFKKPDANTYAYFTYNNIHKIALIGLLGAVAGYEGYNQQCKEHDSKNYQAYPEFYEKLRNLKLCIVPEAKCGYFSKKLQQFNNSVGYASQEEGGNLIVREQWLEEPAWTIYILNDGKSAEAFKKIADNLLEGKCVFVPYLGKNDHPAIIENCSIIEVEPGACEYFTCLFPADMANTGINTWDGSENDYLFREFCPYAMDPDKNFYEYREFVFTNCMLNQNVKNDLTFVEEDNRLIFY